LEVVFAGAAALAILLCPLLLLTVLARRYTRRWLGVPDAPSVSGLVGTMLVSWSAGQLVSWVVGSAAGASIYLALAYQPREDVSIHSGCSFDGVGQFAIGALVGAPIGVLLGRYAFTHWAGRVLLAAVAVVGIVSWIVLMGRPVLPADTCGGNVYRSQAMPVPAARVTTDRGLLSSEI